MCRYMIVLVEKVRYVERTNPLATAPRIIDFNDPALLDSENR